MFQFIPELIASGLQVTSQALLDDGYLETLYGLGRRRLSQLGRMYWDRFRAVMSAKRFDLVWLEKECWPWVPAFLDPGLLAARISYVVDYDDAIFHNYDQSRWGLLRALYGRKIDRVMERSVLVLAGNRYIANRARHAGASRVEIIPSVVDLARYPIRVAEQHRGLVIGWIGSPASQHLIQPLAPILEGVLKSPDDRFVTVGANFASPLFRNHEMVPWSEDREVAELSRFDIGIMPLQDRPFERGKCGFKLIQYMASCIPVIASPVGVNTEIVAHGVNGFLANSGEEWQSALLTLKSSPQLRSSIGIAGRRTVEDRYSLQVTAPRLKTLLHQAAQH